MQSTAWCPRGRGTGVGNTPKPGRKGRAPAFAHPSAGTQARRQVEGRPEQGPPGRGNPPGSTPEVSRSPPRSRSGSFNGPGFPRPARSDPPAFCARPPFPRTCAPRSSSRPAQRRTPHPPTRTRTTACRSRCAHWRPRARRPDPATAPVRERGMSYRLRFFLMHAGRVAAGEDLPIAERVRDAARFDSAPASCRPMGRRYSKPMPNCGACRGNSRVSSTAASSLERRAASW